ncbi:glycosyltransferase family 4 protein [Paenibacillus polymyxa]|uniref:glycosyltransferase family 4 protein n=1 Tax=Paenibacillus polymyxa TaxID=1406 RepID=UPI002379C037|nr:glycosyltransferase family 4 protein [Paenibacillus polymyxa]WDM21584.1 glycosyltransferase family 4 protein [Paenibacillus polymyxa]
MKIAFVIPWYGANISGGSESACRNLAERMVKSGETVDVITTCVKDFHSNWSVNYHKPGSELINGVNVIRFKARKRDTALFDSVNKKLMNNIPISLEEEDIYLKEMVNSPELERYLSRNKDQYKAFIFTPYMFGTTYHGVQQVYEKAILFPAFHDESYAYFERFKEAYSKVKGIVFNSLAELEWAEEHYNIGHISKQVIGLGVEQFITDSEDFRQKFGIKDPFILYAGRRDPGKNVDKLMDYFLNYKKNRPDSEMKLVLLGGGEITKGVAGENSIYDLGFVSEEDKYNAYSAACFFCNPSSFESFSIVIMESWYAKRPVLVYEKCNVTKKFAEESNGGLYFSNYAEFEACVDLLTENHNLADKMGLNGYHFVNSRFSWDRVISNYKEFIDISINKENS